MGRPAAVVDQALRDLTARSCRVVYGMRVNSLMVTPLGLALVVSAHGERRILQARTVVLSGGSGCTLARNLDLDGAPVLTAAVSALLRAKTMPEFPSFLYEPDAPGGYAWIFPLNDSGECRCVRVDAGCLPGIDAADG